jgi:hypothetical protein
VNPKKKGDSKNGVPSQDGPHRWLAGEEQKVQESLGDGKVIEGFLKWV